jgi:RNA polymerase sigma-70 factor (sigma-E family)
MKSSRAREFEVFVRQRRASLLRTAIVLTSGDAHLAEDLVQQTLTSVYLAWPRVRTETAMCYARRCLVNTLIDEQRRPHRREVVAADVPEAATALATTLLELDHELMAALRALPPSMRAAVVLRFVDGLDVEQSAAAMSCSTGNVKSQASRGLSKLRQTLTELNYEGVTE